MESRLKLICLAATPDCLESRGNRWEDVPCVGCLDFVSTKKKKENDWDKDNRSHKYDGPYMHNIGCNACRNFEHQ